MRTPAKALRVRTLRRRLRVRAEAARNGWRLVEADACAVCDPQAMELTAVVGLLMAHVQARAEALDEDCLP